MEGSSASLPRLARGAVLSTVAFLCAAFAHPPGEPEKIKISRRPWFGICAGVCPDYDIVMQTDRYVWVIRRNSGSVEDVRRFRISKRRAAKLRAILEPLRPNGDTREPEECRHDVPPEQAGLVIKAVEMEVKWVGPGRSDRRIGCATPEYEAMRITIDKALATLGVGADARALERRARAARGASPRKAP